MATVMRDEDIRLPLLGTSHKVQLSNKLGVVTGVMYLSPSDESGTNLCPSATAMCAAVCLGHTSGHMVQAPNKAARVRKSKDLLENRPGFVRRLRKDIATKVREAKRVGGIAAVRLNGSSDVAFERMAMVRDIFAEFPEVQFYDYTKRPERMRAYLDGKFPPNYRLTFSRSGENDRECVEVMQRGGNVAVVFQREDAGQFPTEYNPIEDGYLYDSAYSATAPVISGEAHDYRYGDPVGVVVGLKARGTGKKDEGRFFVK